MYTEKKPAKKPLIGFEVELFTIDKQGYVIPAADELLKKAKKDKNITIKKECAKNMTEIASYPSGNIPDTMVHLLRELEYLVSVADKEGVLLLPLGTYPGKFNPVMRGDRQYKIKESIFGKNRWKIGGRCSGFHCHYGLPKGIFDSQLRVLKMVVRSKIKDSFVNSYNFLIAADPALACFMQSSPFYQGRHLGKDSRMIMYRGGDALRNEDGLYANFEEFGGLPHYKPTALDIMDIITTRYETWKAYVKKLELNIKVLSIYGSVLDTAWGPLKINPHGTLEARGMDVNHPIFIAGVGTMIKYILRKLQEEFYTVVPSEIGIKEPFKVEGDIIYIPPFSYVRNELQGLSAYKGLESDAIYNYCRRFLKFSQSVMPANFLKLTEPFGEMLKKRKTVSDEILEHARRRGFRKGQEISSGLAAEIALHHSGRLLKEIISTKKIIEDV